MLSINNLEKKYKNFSLRNVNIDVNDGTIMGFIGPNGAGKSTTIKSILNIIPIDSGKIVVNGFDSIKDEVKVREIIGYVGEVVNLYEDVTADKIYRFTKGFYKKWDDYFFKQIVKDLDIDLNKTIGQFSKGNAMKFSLALALSHNPKLLVLDEPTSGLDPVVREEVLNLVLKMVKQNGCTVLFSSHITEDIEMIADSVTYINKGEVLLTDSKENLLDSYHKIEFLNKIREKIRKESKYIKLNSIIVKDDKDFIRKNNININEVDIKSVRLCDILLHLIKEENNV